MSVELESAKRLNALKAKADAKTGETSDTLADAVDTLIAGFGQGGGGVDLFQYATFGAGAAFRSAVFPENTTIVIKINPVSGQNNSLNNLFTYAKNLVRLKLDFSGITESFLTLSGMCNGCAQLTEIELVGDTARINAMNGSFSDCVSLVSVIGTIDSTNLSTSAPFAKCYALKEIRFKEMTNRIIGKFNDCESLSDASIQSIIDGLADLTGGTAQTITLHADVKAKLTESQISTITGKNWTLA